MDRRTYLGLAGAVALPLAGCANDSGGDSVPATETPPSATTGQSRGERTTESTPSEATAIHDDYQTTHVRVQSPSGEQLGAVTAAVADTVELRYLGLSETPSLPADRGMLFVFDAVATRTFSMREMAFGLDIIYADADGTITRIHHAPAPDPDADGASQQYSGRGQYVLEVGYNWTTDHDVRRNDVLEFSLSTSATHR